MILGAKFSFHDKLLDDAALTTAVMLVNNTEQNLSTKSEKT